MGVGATVHRQVTARAVLLLLFALAIAGCGSGSGGEGAKAGEASCESLSGEPRAECEKEKGGSECERLATEAEREEGERGEAAGRINSADRVAYYQLATAAGLIRGNAAAVAQSASSPPRAGDGELRSSAARVARLTPHDGVLKLVKVRVARLLRAANAGFGRADARAALHELRAIDRALNRYVRYREPAQAALVPG